MGDTFTLVWGLPFAGLVLSIAVLPGAAPAFWVRRYGAVAFAWALAFAVPDMVARGWRLSGFDLGAMALDEYIPFVLLLGTLYIIAGGLRITGAPRGTPAVNTALLGIGTVLAGLIGTPGASLLMLRPMIHANRHRDAHRACLRLLHPARRQYRRRDFADRQCAALSRLPQGRAVLLADRASGAAQSDDHGGIAGDVLRARALPAAPRARRAHACRRSRSSGIEGGINLVLLGLAVVAILLRVLWGRTSEFTLLGLPWNSVDAVSDLLLLPIGLASIALTPPCGAPRQRFRLGAAGRGRRAVRGALRDARSR